MNFYCVCSHIDSYVRISVVIVDKISNKEKERVVKTPNGDVIRELLDGKRVQMIGTQLGYEVQTDWFEKGIIRKAWSADGNLRFRIVSRMLDSDGNVCSQIDKAAMSFSHRTIYKNDKLHSICYTLLGLKTLGVINLEKRDGKVGFVLPKKAFEEITDFPKHKRLMSIRSVRDIKKLMNDRQKEYLSSLPVGDCIVFNEDTDRFKDLKLAFNETIRVVFSYCNLSCGCTSGR